MSNLGPYGGGGKNAPWQRTANPPNNNIQQQLLNVNVNHQAGMNSNMVPFQQQQVFQNMSGMGMQQQNLAMGLQQMPGASALASNQLFQQVGAVTYPNPRALNAAAFQTQPQPQQAQKSLQQAPNATQKVFTGTVTTIHDNFGFVDEDVFFQTSACVKGSNPMVGDRVLVEAVFNPRMPFKWNASRIQVLPMGGAGGQAAPRQAKNYVAPSSAPPTNNYNAVPPPSGDSNHFQRSRPKGNPGGRGRERSRDHADHDDETERKKRREERMREREKEEKKSPVRRRSRSPKVRRRARIVPRYMVQIPKIALDSKGADVLEVRRRYTNLYIPSDFFTSHFRWLDAFPADKPFTLNKPCSFHIMSKDVEPIAENDAVLEPPDADYLFSAKVMLMSVPGMEDLYQKCCAMAENNREGEDRDYVHPTRLINFLVGLRGKNETMAIGGPWSASQDGANPHTDPSVLIKTAIRTCKALTGIDLSHCTKWYRFVELYYRRADGKSKQPHGAPTPAAGGARVETVVLFLPDVWSCAPTRLEWDAAQASYRRHLEAKLAQAEAAESETQHHSGGAGSDEKEEDDAGKLEPTHHSQLDPKTMSHTDLRRELAARALNANGLKSQLAAKLHKALRGEASSAATSGTTATNCDKLEDGAEDQSPIEDAPEVVKLDEKERLLLEKKHTLPDQQHIIVHPSRAAKGGKFDCTVMSLSLLLDYRPEDTKEHSFEVSLFAELFNEMLMRDFAFCIYRALYDLPEKEKDKASLKLDADNKDTKEKDKKKDAKDKDNKDKDAKDNTKEKDNKKKEKDSIKSESEDDALAKSERPKMYTKERHLLLSFIYFDQTHCGYIFEKDVEELLYTLGLNLSRAQVRKLVGKVITRDSLHYRKLTDKPKEEDFIVIDDSEKDCNLEELAAGNKRLLPVFGADGVEQANGASADEGFLMFRGAIVDVAKLLAQLERSEKARLDTEARMMDMKAENGKLADKYAKANGSAKSLSADLKDYKEKLKISEDSLHRTTACSKLFQSTLLDIRDKIEPVLHSSKDSKSRWEKDTSTSSSSSKTSKTTRDKAKSKDKDKTHTSEKDAKDKDAKDNKDKDKATSVVNKKEPEVKKVEEVFVADEFKPEVIDEVGDVGDVDLNLQENLPVDVREPELVENDAEMPEIQVNVNVPVANEVKEAQCEPDVVEVNKQEIKVKVEPE